MFRSVVWDVVRSDICEYTFDNNVGPFKKSHTK